MNAALLRYCIESAQRRTGGRDSAHATRNREPYDINTHRETHTDADCAPLTTWRLTSVESTRPIQQVRSSHRSDLERCSHPHRPHILCMPIHAPTHAIAARKKTHTRGLGSSVLRSRITSIDHASPRPEYLPLARSRPKRGPSLQTPLSPRVPGFRLS